MLHEVLDTRTTTYALPGTYTSSYLWVPPTIGIPLEVKKEMWTSWRTGTL